jgi:hypothetical protein
MDVPIILAPKGNSASANGRQSGPLAGHIHAAACRLRMPQKSLDCTLEKQN